MDTTLRTMGLDYCIDHRFSSTMWNTHYYSNNNKKSISDYLAYFTYLTHALPKSTRRLHVFPHNGPVLILPSVLNCLMSPRPHIFLDMQTRSANGLLLHITDKQGFARVILFMRSGRVKLFVGDGTLIYYQKKINNGAWHNVCHWIHDLWMQNDIIGL